MNVKKISTILKKNQDRLKNEFKVKSLHLFGSAASGKFKKGSDIDLLVQFYEPIGIFEFVALKDFLQKTLKSPVDLVTQDAIRPWMVSDIERTSVRVA